LGSGDTRIYLEIEVRRVCCRTCNAVKREKLDFLADNPFYPKRFAWLVGRRCRHPDPNGSETFPIFNALKALADSLGNYPICHAV
jgi:hypothetical protein